MNIVINLNKPEHISSHRAANDVKRLLAARKAGHAGTLDPIATGVLIVCLNEATKITRFLSVLDKEYIVGLKLGERTDTYDSTGRVVETRDCRSIRENDLHEMMKNFVGLIKQVPPMYSAVKMGGQPLYKLARKGIDIERPGREIYIYGIDLMSFSRPYVDLRVECSRGTYIRTLCDDIGKALGTGAHMLSLKRTRVGNFRIEDSESLEGFGHKETAYHEMDSVLSHLGEIVLDNDSYNKAINGVPVARLDKSVPITGKNGDISGRSLINKYVRLKSPERVLFGVGRIEDEDIKIERLLNTSLPRL
jgi:tRNA pseudouridine55 synthase